MNRNAEVDLARCQRIYAGRLELSPEDRVDPGVEALNASVKVLEEWILEAERRRERTEALEKALHNVRLYAASETRLKSSEARETLLRFCREVGIEGSILREEPA
jgi:hypothetical protein